MAQYTLHEKEYSEPVDFKLVDADLSKYASIMYERDSLARDTTVKEKNIDYLQDNMKFSEFSPRRRSGSLSEYFLYPRRENSPRISGRNRHGS